MAPKNNNNNNEKRKPGQPKKNNNNKKQQLREQIQKLREQQKQQEKQRLQELKQRLEQLYQRQQQEIMDNPSYLLSSVAVSVRGSKRNLDEDPDQSKILDVHGDKNNILTKIKQDFWSVTSMQVCDAAKDLTGESGLDVSEISVEIRNMKVKT
ncbi:hypothetical protein Glove_232g201 [Diversispora epigaea]|uniref:Uncharacterized protein n=1 Tax=Diversispora epigaea TaxID=1348612 RepID=A0A397IBN6_9GLOM|nr:hypothetical protein Glove_232g201 [Diversispora epigaea]